MRDQDRESTFRPISPNPFIVGTPIRDRSMFFGREFEFELVRRRFQGSRRGGLLVFCGERRSGKTSVLFQILDGRLGPDFLPILIDMQSMAIDSEVDFFERISAEILKCHPRGEPALVPPDYRTASSPSAAFRRFIDSFLAAFPESKPIFLIDEYELLEDKIEAGKLNRDILYVFSNLMENSSVCFVFTGSDHLEERRKEYWRILGKSIHRRITFLDKADAVSLITQPVRGDVEYEDSTVESIWRLTAGHPFYTQAICQNLVDLLNETHSRRANEEVLSSVVQGMVDNPLPQMIFLWDGLKRDEKLTLSLLAESLEGQDSFARPKDLLGTLAIRGYPFDLDRTRVATTLEELCRKELLFKHPTDQQRHAFRMDLWRRWILRAHSVWQVMREEGMGPKGGRMRRRGRRRLLGVGAVLLACAIVVGYFRENRSRSRPSLQPPDLAETSTLSLTVHPEGARILHEGKPVGTGSFLGKIESARRHLFTINAPGYADSSFAITAGDNESIVRRISLRPLTGSLAITTDPARASIWVDGAHRGTAPLIVRGLAVTQEHEIQAALTGHESRSVRRAVKSDTTLSVFLALPVTALSVGLSTSPPGAEVAVDDRPPAISPFTIQGLRPGSHRFQARHPGYTPADTLITVSPENPHIHLTLQPAPPGILIIEGNRPATFYIDGRLVIAGVQNSEPQELPPGDHEIQVVLYDGRSIDRSIRVVSGESVVYDFSRGTLTRLPLPSGEEVVRDR